MSGGPFQRPQRRFGLVLALALVAAALVAAPAAHSYEFGDTVQPSGPVTDVWDPQASGCTDPPWTFPTVEDPEPEGPDLPVRAYRDTGGTAWLVLPRADKNRRVRLSDLSEDCGLILSHRDQGGGGSNPSSSSYEWLEWVASPYVLADGRIASLVYNEYLGFHFPDAPNPGHCNPPAGGNGFSFCWERAITHAVSNDGGVTYDHVQAPPLHRVANLPYAYGQHPNWGANGYFAPTNIVRKSEPGGDYYYSFFNVLTSPKSGFQNGQKAGVCVMRTQDLMDPSSWRGWGDGDGDGDNEFDVQFANPYPQEPSDPLRHVCKSLTHTGNPSGPERADLKADFIARSLTYNTYFDKYLLIGVSGDAFYYSLSDDLLDWSPRRELMDAPSLGEINAQPDPDCTSPVSPVAHPSIVDPASTSPSFETSGQTVDLYFTKRKLAANAGTGECFNTANELARVRITFTDNARVAAGASLACPRGFDLYSAKHGATFAQDTLRDYRELGTSYTASLSAGGNFAYGVLRDDLSKDGVPANCEQGAPGSRRSLRLGEGEHVWYGGAFQFSSEFWAELDALPPKQFASITFMRLSSDGVPGWAGQLLVLRNRMARFNSNDGTTTTQLLQTSSGDTGIPIPEDNDWHYFLVHQRLSSDPSVAVNELWFDGVKQETVDAVNIAPGAVLRSLKAGIVLKSGDVQPTVFVDYVRLGHMK